MTRDFNKLFVIGLPRTGTTSLSVALLEHGYKVAHTAFTQRSFELAEVIADTPCYCDYPQLDALFPNSKFVYLNRGVDSWLPSIRMLLNKMAPNLQPEGRFNPTMKRCFNDTFELNKTTDLLSDSHLSHCYQQHQHKLLDYFSNRDDLLSIPIHQSGSLSTLLNFIGKDTAHKLDFPHLNAGNMVTTWKDIKHPNKISSNASGHRRRKFFDYAQ